MQPNPQQGIIPTFMKFPQTVLSALQSAGISLFGKMRGNTAKWAKIKRVASKRYVDDNDQDLCRKFLFIPTNVNGKNKFWLRNISEEDRNDPIVSYQVRSCRMLHYSFSWIVTALIILIPKLDFINHWWVTIETANGKIYNLQLFFNQIILEEIIEGCDGQCPQNCIMCINQKKRKSDQHGLAGCYLQNENSCVWSQPQYSKNQVADKTMDDVIGWFISDNVNADFDFFRRNCQDLCRNFYKAI